MKFRIKITEFEKNLEPLSWFEDYDTMEQARARILSINHKLTEELFDKGLPDNYLKADMTIETVNPTITTQRH